MMNGDIDTTYYTMQRDLFASGLGAQVGPNPYMIWSAIKCHADFETGKAWPSVRRLAEMTGLGLATVMRAIEVLEGAHMLRKASRGWPGDPAGKRGRSHTYVARERMDVRLGTRVLCTVVIDYVPLQVHKRLAAVKAALQKPDQADPSVWAQVDIIPGPGFVWDPDRKVLTAQIHAGDVPAQAEPAARTAARAELQQLARKLKAPVPKT